jgi:tetratricopeptide (TPR) repeat protein
MQWERETKRAGRPSVRLVLDAAREAEEVLDREAGNHPSYADIRHRRGLLGLVQGDFDVAQREFEDALGIHPGYRAAYCGLRLTHLLQGRVPSGCVADGGVGEASAEEACWIQVDAAYCRRNEGKDPLDALTRGEGEETSSFYEHYAAAFALMEGKSADVRAHLEAAAAKSAIARRHLEDLRVLPWGETSSEIAHAHLGTLLWSPLAADLYAYLGNIYARNGLRTEALECFEKAFMVFPREADYGMHRAQIAIAAGEETEALELLKQAIEADPGCVDARIALGFEYASQGFADEARVQFEEAAKLAPGYADIRYNLGLLYVAGDSQEVALEQFRKALNLNRSYLPARHSMAALLCRMGRHEEGLREYEGMLRQGFQSADMLAQMGRAALALKQIDEALQYLERARFLNPDFVLTYYYLGQAYRRKGLKNKARSAWRRYLESAGELRPNLIEDEGGGPSS